MKNLLFFLFFVTAVTNIYGQPGEKSAAPVVKIASGTLQGKDESGVHSFKGIPFAAPPVGKLRWREPQPVQNWQGVKKADKFGPKAMQRPVFGDMNFRSDGTSEDCLYLNVWTPAQSSTERLPVLVYFYGGGFIAGDGSEPRYDGESMARKGIVAITVNYRLNIFGFFAHPELTKESPYHASGNYGLLDQSAALRWVQQNISAFGGDPKKVTIAGESAGSFSVSAQMASPLSKNLMAGAIGESGSLLGTSPPASLSEAEQAGAKFASGIGVNSLAALRAMSAEDLLETTAKANTPRFSAIVDGYFLPDMPAKIYSKGEQAHVPLLVGWNSQEMSAGAIMGESKVTKENFTSALQKMYGEKATQISALYNGSTDEEVQQAVTDLASDRFIGFSTWKWSDLQSKTGGKPVYRYLYARPRPAMRAEMGNAVAGLAGGVIRNADTAAVKKLAPGGAVHSAEIEYALGNLPTNRVYDWQPEDYKVSEIMQAYFANFIKTGNPNGTGLPAWPATIANSSVQVMHVDVNTQAQPEKNRERYLFLDKTVGK